MGEMIFVRGDQSVDDRKAIEGYLSHKWKMSDLLPESTLMQSRIYISTKTGKLPLIVLLITRTMLQNFSSV